jgi:hypothetical protein
LPARDRVDPVVARCDLLWEILVDLDMTLGGEGDCRVSLSCLLVPLVVLSMEEKYGDHVRWIGTL